MYSFDPNIGICIDDDSDNPEDLENIINKIINLEYPRNKIKIVIYSIFDKVAARIPALVSKLKSENIRCSAVFTIEDNVFENETSVFTKLENATFLAKLSSKSSVNLQKTLDKINQIYNDESKQVLVFKNKDGVFIDKTYVSKSYLDHLDYSKMQEAILNKVTNTEHLYNIT
tara:strand:+ start:228 stop:743 length:516 start_codon:yes stop_codon:yes gene_type:complete